MTSSDFTVNISCNVYTAEYASNARTSISQNLWPPCLDFPPSGCWVINEYGPTDLAWILSSTMWTNLRMCMYPTVTF